MLILKRHVGEVIYVGDNVRIMLTSIEGDKARIGIDAPEGVVIEREEVRQRRQLEEREAMATLWGKVE